MGYLIDTNIWSFLLRKRSPALAAKFGKLAKSEVFLSPIVRGELELGFSKGDQHPTRRAALDLIYAKSTPLVIDSAVADKYGQLRGAMELAGTPIGRNDTWIAAEALHHNLMLITDNIREFERVAGLRVENWTE
jgi:tRNA(fMet)-specific endonuclease VapC